MLNILLNHLRIEENVVRIGCDYVLLDVVFTMTGSSFIVKFPVRVGYKQIFTDLVVSCLILCYNCGNLII